MVFCLSLLSLLLFYVFPLPAASCPASFPDKWWIHFAVWCGRFRYQSGCWDVGSGTERALTDRPPLPLFPCVSVFWSALLLSPIKSVPICPWIFLLLLLAGYSMIVECTKEEPVLNLGHSRVGSLFPGGSRIPNHPPPWPLGAEG